MINAVWRHALVWACLLALGVVGRQAGETCKVPKVTKFDLFSKTLKRRFPRKTTSDAIPWLSVDPAWRNLCLGKDVNAYRYGVTDGTDQCWVIQKLWYTKCKTQICKYTFTDVSYFRCHQHYTAISFWAYCRSDDWGGDIRLLVRAIPTCCECRRYICPRDRETGGSTGSDRGNRKSGSRENTSKYSDNNNDISSK